MAILAMFVFLATSVFANDYPYESDCAYYRSLYPTRDAWSAVETGPDGSFCTAGADPESNFCKCECTAYAAFKVNNISQSINFTNVYNLQPGSTWGNGGSWDDSAESANPQVSQSNVPFPGDIAFWNSTYQGDTIGHVAEVESAEYDAQGNYTKLDISEYNYSSHHSFGTRTITTDGRPDGFIHFLDHVGKWAVCSPYDADKKLCWNVAENDVKCTSGSSHFFDNTTLGICQEADSDDCSGVTNAIVYVGIPGGFGSGSDGVNSTEPNMPNLQIDEFNIHDSTNNLLTESVSPMNISQIYEIQNWPVSMEENCLNGIEPGKDTVETDTFYKISLSENGGDWKFLGRNYTRCVNMDENDSKKEILSFIVPPEAVGKRVYFRSKVDSTGEVSETDEHDNWSDVEWYPVPGSCDLIISYARLTGGRTSLQNGEHFGFEMAVKNLGPDTCSHDIRSAYYQKRPGSSTWDLLTSDETDAQNLLVGQDNFESILDESPFVADTPGVHEGKVCADYLESNPESNEGNNCTTFSFVVNPPNYAPTGNVDIVNCTNIQGWASDSNTANPIDVHVYRGDINGNNKVFQAGFPASVYRGDVGSHGFVWSIPTSLKTGTAHTLFFYAINTPAGTNPLIGQTQIVCATPIYNLFPTYRAYSSYTQSHVLTIGEAEKNALYAGGWILEGVVFYAHDRQEPNTAPVYRFYRTGKGHFFTISEAEKNSFIGVPGWTFEGVVFYDYPWQVSGTVPVYRLYSPSKMNHFWTSSVAEKDNAVTYGGYLYEGVGWYTYQNPPN